MAYSNVARTTICGDCGAVLYHEIGERLICKACYGHRCPECDALAIPIDSDKHRTAYSCDRCGLDFSIDKEKRQ